MYKIALASISFIFGLNQLSSQVFQKHQITSDGDNQIAYVYDIDNDGDNDLITRSLDWYENIDNKGFHKMKPMAKMYSGSTTLQIQFIDFDVDGDLDILSTEYNSSTRKTTIWWCENFGGGSFGKQTAFIDTLESGAIIRDMDSDGDYDLVFKNKFDSVQYYKNDGGLSFTKQVVSNSRNFRDVADVNGDGYLDYLLTQYQNTWYWILLSNGPTSFKSISLTSYQWGYPKFKDVDLDGKIDVYAPEENGWFRYFGNDSICPFSKFDGAGPASPPTWSDRFTDLDNDGKGDLLRSYGSHPVNGISWFKGDGNGKYGPAIHIGQNIRSNGFGIGDFDGNGYDDVFYSDYSQNGSMQMFGNFSGRFQQVTSPSTQHHSNGRYVQNGVYDINGDNKNDIVHTGGFVLNDTITSLDSNYQYSQSEFKGYESFHADIDGDSLIDIIAVDDLFDYSLVWFKNLGDYKFSTKRIISDSLGFGTRNYTQLRMIDFNNDGRVDISVPCNNKIWIFQQGANGYFTKIQTNLNWTNNYDWADLDGDNDLDFTTPTAWYKNNGTSTFTRYLLGGGSADGFTIFDADNDGDIDIFTSENFSYFGLVWFENSGTGSFTRRTYANGYGKPAHLSSADVDNDGDRDVIVSFTGSSRRGVMWVQNSGNRNFDTLRPVPFNSHVWKCLGTDIDADGHTDLVAETQNGLSWFKNKGDKTFDTLRVIDKSSSFYFNFGDFDKDGLPEIYGSNNNSSYNQICIWKIGNSSTYTANGMVYHDQNSNKRKDTNEHFLYPKQFIKQNQHLLQAAYSSSSNYNVQLGKGSSTFNPLIDSSWVLTTDSASFTTLLSDSIKTMDSLNFGYRIKNKVTKVSRNIQTNDLSCSTDGVLSFSIENQGTTKPKMAIELELNDSLSFKSCQPHADSVRNQTIYWTVDTLDYFGLTQYSIKVKTSGQAGNTILSYLKYVVTDSSGTVNSSDTMSNEVKCGLGINNYKSSNTKGFGAPNFISDSSLIEYTIHFQNTTNDTVMNLSIIDHLDKNLDWSSFKLLNASHSFNYNISSNGMVEFRLPSTPIPDSSSDFFASRGSVSFQIRAKAGLKHKDRITNLAKIWFDQTMTQTNALVHTIFKCQVPKITIQSTTQCLNSNMSLKTNPEYQTSYSWRKGGNVISTNPQCFFRLNQAPLDTVSLRITSASCPTFDTSFTFNVSGLSSKTDSVVICDDTSAVISGKSQSTQGIYYDTLAGFGTCDTINAIFLKVNNTYQPNLPDLFICDGDSALIFGSHQKVNGSFQNPLISSEGCDSIIHQKLIIVLPQNNELNDLSICQGDSALIFGKYENVAGQFSKLFASSLGCDSLVKQNLVIVQPSFKDLGQQDFCQKSGFDFAGRKIFAQGIYQDTLPGQFGCDSVLKIDARAIVPDTQIVKGSNYLEATTSGKVNWLNCKNMTLEIDSSNKFYPNADGLYALVVEENGCRDTTSCLNVLLNVDWIKEEVNNIQVYPNPTSSLLNIEWLDRNQEVGKLTLLNAIGQVVLNRPIDRSKTAINLSELSNGIYILEVESPSGLQSFRIVKE